MALTRFQRRVCRLLAESRRRRGDSYVAGAAALNELLEASRLSEAVDLFHDSDEALRATWDADRSLLEAQGLGVEVQRERPTFVEAVVTAADEHLRIQWARDSAFRFFPLIEHDDFGLTLHPYDLATNKVLALVGRLEPRDWVDVLAAHERLQPLGCLAWGACGKDPGFGPGAILSQARRSARYTQTELDELAFDGEPPDAASLSRSWRGALAEADEMIKALPAERAGSCVLDGQLRLFREQLPVAQLSDAVRTGALRFHEGRIQGAFPEVLAG